MTTVAFPDVKVFINAATSPLTAGDFALSATNQSDFSSYLLSFDITRGRQNAQSHFDAGSLTLELDNQTGIFDPTYTGAAFYPKLGVGNRVSIYATLSGLFLFSGYITGMQPQYDYTGGERMVITATDMFTLLGLQNWSLRTSLAATTADVIIKDILTDCGFSTSWVTGDVGQSLCQAPLDDPANPGQTVNALQTMQAAAEDTEAGLLFVNAAGKLVFYNRYKRINQSGATSITFGDGGGSEVEYEQDIAPILDDSFLINGMTITDSFGTNYTYTDPTSIAQYGPRFNTLTTLDAYPNEAGDEAAFLVQNQKDLRLRIDQVTIRPIYTSEASWTPLLSIDDFGVDSCTIKRRPPSGNIISQDSFIERIQHTFNGEEWTVTFGVSARVIAINLNWLLLNDASKGKLNTGVLGF